MKTIARFLNKVLHGGSYCVVHFDADGSKRSRHWCDTWAEALEWAACSLRDDVVSIRDCNGQQLAVRNAAA